MRFRATVLARRLLLCAAFLGFACRAWVPAGYMPAVAADGGPVVLCPGGPGGAVIARLLASRADRHSGHVGHGHHGGPASPAGPTGHDGHGYFSVAEHPGSHHADHDGGRGEHEDGHPGFDASYCPLGVSAAFAALAHSFEIGLLDLAFSLDIPAEAPTAALVPLRAYESRAPPFI
jgi:hypothetical protein